MTSTQRPALRADAARNRDAIVEAARAVFAEQGLGAPLDEIARRAGVGNATLYRRFPTRDDLVEAALLEPMQEYLDAAARALRDPDPGRGLRGYLLHLFELQARDRGLAEGMTTALPAGTGALQRLHEQALELTRQLIANAQASEQLREDFQAHDLPLLLMANAGVVARTRTSAPTAWKRAAAFILDGLGSDAATAGPAPLSEQQVQVAMAANTAPAAE